MPEYDYLEMMPCSLNDFSERTHFVEPELIVEFGKALNMYRLAVQKERRNREQQLQIVFE